MAAPHVVKEIEDASAEIANWDPVLTERVVGILRPIVKRYFRSEVRGLSLIPSGGALLVANHSGGVLVVRV